MPTSFLLPENGTGDWWAKSRSYIALNSENVCGRINKLPELRHNVWHQVTLEVLSFCITCLLHEPWHCRKQLWKMSFGTAVKPLSRYVECLPLMQNNDLWVQSWISKPKFRSSEIWQIWWLGNGRTLVFTKYCSTVREVGEGQFSRMCTRTHTGMQHSNKCSCGMLWTDRYECQFHLLSAWSSHADLMLKLCELWPNFHNFLMLLGSNCTPHLVTILGHFQLKQIFKSIISINHNKAYKRFYWYFPSLHKNFMFSCCSNWYIAMCTGNMLPLDRWLWDTNTFQPAQTSCMDSSVHPCKLHSLA